MEQESKLKDASGGTKYFVQLLILSFGFFGLFSAFGAIQGLMSTLIRGQLGYWSMATIYMSNVFCALLLGTAVVRYFKPKFSMMMAGLFYINFISANLRPTWNNLILSSVFLGFGASILWAGEGSYLTMLATQYSRAKNKPLKSSMGYFNGIFFGIFNLSIIVGNIVESFVYDHNDPQSIYRLCFIYLGLATVGNLLFLLLDQPETEDSQPFQLTTKFLQTFHLMKDKRMLLIIPIILYSGLEQGFLFGDFTKEVITPVLGAENIGFVICVYAIVSACSSPMMGHAYDRYGKKHVVVLGFGSHYLVFLVLLIYSNWYSIEDLKQHSRYYIYAMAAIYGLGDAIWMTFINTIMSIFFTDKSEAAFSNLKIWQSCGYFFAFYFGALEMSMSSKLLVNVVVLLVSCLLLYALDKKISGGIDSLGDEASRDVEKAN